MNLSTLKATFDAIFDRSILTADAKRFGAYERERKVAAFDFVLALLTSLTVGPERSIASTRRAWENLTGQTIAPNSFDEHFNPGMVRVLWNLIHGLFKTSNRAMRRAWPAPLRELYDILIIDGTRMAVDAGLAEILRSTTPGQASLKLIGVLSLGKGQLQDIRAGAGVHHDHKLLRLELVAGVLYLLDLGFYDHDMFAAYADAHALFVSRLKDNVMPKLAHVVRGVVGGRRVEGLPLDGDLTYRAEVDVDAHFTVRDDPEAKTRMFRVVKLDVPLTDRHGKPKGGWCSCWFVTNLPRETWTVAMIAALYRLRWAIERLWREAKSFARLDHLRSERPVVLFIFLAASLLFHVLSDRITRQLELAHGIGQVSRDRVLATLIVSWRDLVRDLRAIGTVSSRSLADLSALMEREGRHPNPGQPRLIKTVFRTIEKEAQAILEKAA